MAQAAISSPGLDMDRTGTRNVLRLAVAQALAVANSVVLYATGAVVGSMLAPSPVLATAPVSIFVVGMAACTLPAGVVARRYGRRAAFSCGPNARPSASGDDEAGSAMGLRHRINDLGKRFESLSASPHARSLPAETVVIPFSGAARQHIERQFSTLTAGTIFGSRITDEHSVEP